MNGSQPSSTTPRLMQSRRSEGNPSSAQNLEQAVPLTTEFNTIQYNCGNANYKPARSFLDRLDPSRHHLAAVQEPYFNSAARTTYCPPGYTLCYQPA